MQRIVLSDFKPEETRIIASEEVGPLVVAICEEKVLRGKDFRILGYAGSKHLWEVRQTSVCEPVSTPWQAADFIFIGPFGSAFEDRVRTLEKCHHSNFRHSIPPYQVTVADKSQPLIWIDVWKQADPAKCFEELQVLHKSLSIWLGQTLKNTRLHVGQF